MTNAVVIVAAGRSTRMGGDSPKQYRALAGKCVLQHSIDAFAAHEQISHIQVVIHDDHHLTYNGLVSAHDKLAQPVLGGATRQESGLAGLRALARAGPDKVLIHDAARPFVSAEVISATLASIAPGICALPASAIADTVKRAAVNGKGNLIVSQTVPRDDLYVAQTPQGFMFDEILSAHEDLAARGVNNLTDDAAVGEAAGMAVVLTLGDSANSKITTQSDYDRAIERMEIPDIRTGNGYDVHRLVPGDGVILCGVHILHDRSLAGHSDADVGLHALTDALLGTIGEGDIGSHFPPTDVQWKDAASDRFLAHACELVRTRGGRISHLDVTLVCEAPKIGPHREAMRKKIAEICAIETGRVAVKATTNEQIGFVGRKEGIAALATATVGFQS